MKPKIVPIKPYLDTVRSHLTAFTAPEESPAKSSRYPGMCTCAPSPSSTGMCRDRASCGRRTETGQVCSREGFELGLEGLSCSTRIRHYRGQARMFCGGLCVRVSGFSCSAYWSWLLQLLQPCCLEKLALKHSFDSIMICPCVLCFGPKLDCLAC